MVSCSRWWRIDDDKTPEGDISTIRPPKGDEEERGIKS